MKTVFISVDNNPELYDKCVRKNSFVTNISDVEIVGFDNTKDNKFISVRYNEFLNSWDYSKEAWFVFCHNDWQLLEDISLKLNNLDKNSIYGPIGATLYKKNDNHYIREYCGDIYERKKDGSNYRYLKSKHSDTGTRVDILDAQCMIVHSSLIDKYNYRFDECFEYDMYVEDFLLNAKISHSINTYILALKCCHWSQVDDIFQRPWYFPQLDMCIEKYKDYELCNVIKMISTKNKHIETFAPDFIDLRNDSENASIYSQKIDCINDNHSRGIISNWINPETNVLDVGCSGGFLGLLLQDKKCRMTGFEFDDASILMAKENGCYEDVYKVDLNNFETESFKELENKFDYIVCGDVLEHLFNPLTVVKKLLFFLKPNGSLCVSLPNVSHASIKAALLSDKWEYTPFGILDKTHLRFFTKHSIPDLFAQAYLEIKDLKYTTYGVKGCPETNNWQTLSIGAKKIIKKDVHSFIWQYVMLLSVDKDKTFSELKDLNTAKFDIKKSQYNKYLKKNIKKTHLFYF